MGKSQSTISNKLRLLKLDTEIINKIVENELTERHARKLLMIKEKKLQNEIIDKILKNQLNVKQTDVLVDNILNIEKVKKRKRNTQFKLSSNIYVNTIKKAYDEIVGVGIEAEFEKTINDKYIELKIKIPK
jgi:ParB family chromosome partitioning protein